MPCSCRLTGSSVSLHELQTVNDEPAAPWNDEPRLPKHDIFTLYELVEALTHLSERINVVRDLELRGSPLPTVGRGMSITLYGTCGKRQCKLDAKGRSHIFLVYGGTLTIRNLDLVGGHGGSRPGDFGGLIMLEGGALEMYDSALRDSQAWSGGAVYAGGEARVHLTRCSIRNNQALASAYSAGVAGGGAFFINGSRLTLQSCSTVANGPVVRNGTASQGGAVLCGWGAEVTFRAGEASWNEAAYGGVVKSDWDSVVSFLDGCEVHENKAYAGAVVYSWGSSNVFHHAVLRDNVAAGGGSILAAANPPPRHTHNLEVVEATVNGDPWSSAALCNPSCTTYLANGATANFHSEEHQPARRAALQGGAPGASA
ncbi:hypothetical protein CYMTET_42912 [Cymbomonas tetramitiformis]|uniref:Right handed beta helix domain-containing protein n=1 Tax=Cymbomonas tetramitiformis TaxID=36881 RepID=A0AAE0C4I6_9CHLO|nr:hypothetical protein CYMTET_42912 [Cymbomonas tetramitiformis]